MKSAFEDAGFKIVEEIEWVYLTGLPKNQDIGKLFDKKAGKKRPLRDRQRPIGGKQGVYEGQGGNWGETENIPQTEESKTWNGWKTAGLKPAHEPITIFQKPLEGTYIQNINKYGCGGMNIDACRIEFAKNDDTRIGKGYKHHAKAGLENAQQKDNSSGKLLSLHNSDGRFPPNMIIDEYIAEEFDEQTGNKESKKSMRGIGFSNSLVYGNGDKDFDTERGYNDSGGGSRMFPIIKYCTKVSTTERKLPNGERNPHVTLKPVELIKWLIKLVTPINGKTIDITAGSCTHAVACEELNKNEGYNLKYIDIELMNTESEPYCDVGKMRVEEVV
jgi:site-specific DNA-methyltransferase (adenine-specific)